MTPIEPSRLHWVTLGWVVLAAIALSFPASRRMATLRCASTGIAPDREP
jgi:hypothetical protein